MYVMNSVWFSDKKCYFYGANRLFLAWDLQKSSNLHRFADFSLRRRVRSRGNYHSAMVKNEKSVFLYFNIFSLFLHKCHLLYVNVWNLHQNQNLMDTFMVYHACISWNLWKNRFCHLTYSQLEEWICIKNKDIKNPKT